MPQFDDALIRTVRFQIFFLHFILDFISLQACRGQHNGALVQDPRDCRRFFECQNEQIRERECPQGDLFESSMQICMSEGAVNCGMRRSNDNKILPPTNGNDGGISRDVLRRP